jgi:predicted MPP superfamily phosphohydrolase
MHLYKNVVGKISIHHVQINNKWHRELKLEAQMTLTLVFDDYSSVAGKPAVSDIAIGVTHAPYLRVLSAMSEDNLDAIFAGHTHGGQVRLPLPGASKALHNKL